jgi:hypothetical protein
MRVCLSVTVGKTARKNLVLADLQWQPGPARLSSTRYSMTLAIGVAPCCFQAERDGLWVTGAWVVAPCR